MPTGREELAHALLLHVAAGTLDVQEAAPALRALVGGASGSAPRRLSLLEALRAEPPAGLAPVIAALQRLRFRDAEAAHALKAASQPLTPELAAELADLPLDVPLGFRTGTPAGARWADAYELLQHHLFLDGAGTPPRLREGVAAALRAAAACSPRLARKWGRPTRRSRLRSRRAPRSWTARRAPPWPARTRRWTPCPCRSRRTCPRRLSCRASPRASAAGMRRASASCSTWPSPGPRRPWCRRCSPSPRSRGRRSARSSCSRCASAACTGRTGAPGARGCTRRSWPWRAPGPSPPPSRRRSSG